MTMDRERLKALIQESLKEFFEHERDLIDVDANERSISYKIAEYITPKFSDWDVDCEYNRDGTETKLLEIPVENVPTNDTKGKTVYPDIIIHQRKDKTNLLIIEIKKSGLLYTHDVDKINAFLKSPEYSYTFGLMLIINIPYNPDQPYNWEWFQ